MPTARGYECVFTGYLAGQFVQTVQHMEGLEADGDEAFPSAAALASEIAGNGIGGAFMDMLPEDYAISSLRVRRVYPTTGPTAIVLAGVFANQVGQRSGEISSAQVNPVTVWIPTTTPTDLGRMFIPGVSEDDIDEMVLQSSLVTAIELFNAAWIAGATPSAVTYYGAIARRRPTSPYDVLAMDRISYSYVSPLIGTQRRRLRPV